MRQLLFFSTFLFSLTTWSAAADTNRVIEMNDQALELAYTDPVKAMELAEKSRDFARKIAYKRGEVRAIIRIGIIYDVTAHYDKAIGTYKDAAELAKKSKDTKALASCWNNIGLIYYKNNSYKQALKYFNLAYFEFLKLDDNQNLGSVTNNIGLLYDEFDQEYKAAWFYRKALIHYKRSGDDYSMNDVYSNLGNLYHMGEISNPDSCEYYTAKAIEGYLKTDNKYGLGIAYNNLALHYQDLNKPELSTEYYLKAMKADAEVGNTHAYVSAGSNLSRTYLQQNKRKEAFEILKSIYDSLPVIDSHEISFKVCAVLAQSYYYFGDKEMGEKITREFTSHHEAYYKEMLKQNFAAAEKKFQVKASRQRSQFLYDQQKEAHARENLYWFGGMLAIFLTGLLIFFIIRKGNLQKELENQKAVFEATSEERKRISYDLHDHVGSQLSYVVNNLELIQHSNEKDERINRTFQMSQAAMSSLRDTVWALHTEELSISSLAARMENVAAKTLENSPEVSFNIEIDTDPEHETGPQETMHIMRIFQEAVHNVVKHANASELRVHIWEEAGNINLSIRDNGRGMGDLSGKPFHYGLQSMKERAGKIGGKISISSAEGQGTHICLSWPKNRSIA